MKKHLTLLIALCLGLAATGCGGSSSAAKPAAEKPAVVVTVKGMKYSPAEVTIEAGQTVEWRFEDGGVPHDVTGQDGLQSELIGEGTYRHTFKTAGTFSYYCSVHTMMTGKVIVE